MQTLEKEVYTELTRLGFIGTELVKALDVPNKMTILLHFQRLRREFILSVPTGKLFIMTFVSIVMFLLLAIFLVASANLYVTIVDPSTLLELAFQTG